MLIAAGSSEVALGFIELGLLILALAILARLAGRFGISAIPLYLLAGLAVGEGGFVHIDVSIEFFELGAEIGVLLLLFALGLEYSGAELRSGLRTGMAPGLFDMVLNTLPGVGLGLLLGWEPLAAVLLGGVTWISSSGVVSKVLSDLGRLGFRETPAVLNLLVMEDLAMAVYLPVVAALIVGGTIVATLTSVAIALVTVAIIMLIALKYGRRMSSTIAGGSDEAFMLTVFGITLLVAGIAQRLDVSGAIGAFLVGLAISGQAEQRAKTLISPLRDLFAAMFFLFFSFQIDPVDLIDAAGPALALAIVGVFTKMATGWYAAGRLGVGPRGRMRAATVLIARGEFSIVIAALGSALVDGPELGALAAGYVLVTAMIGPLATKSSAHIPIPSILSRRRITTNASSNAAASGQI
jgi:CPA2 family monovalent cation:H+ antiporter-2